MFDLVEMQRQREAQRLVRIQPEIAAHGFHRQVETNLIVRSLLSWVNELACCAKVESSAENFSDNFAGEHICPCDCTSKSPLMVSFTSCLSATLNGLALAAHTLHRSKKTPRR